MNSPDARDNKDNPVALISGGAAGIGRTIACAFLADGYGVHICDSSRENVEAFVAENPAATASIADVADAAQVETVFADLADRYGRLDVLVNNAGIAGPTARVQDISIDDWDECIGVDLSGLFYMTRLAVPLLRQRDGSSIINIASTAALHGYPLRSAYAASKWAQVGLTKTWAMELGPEGIRVNAVCPTSVDGERIEGVIEREASSRGVSSNEIRDIYLRQTSMRSFASADEVADTVLFLASDNASRISGQAISVDGHTEGFLNWLDQ